MSTESNNEGEASGRVGAAETLGLRRKMEIVMALGGADVVFKGQGCKSLPYGCPVSRLLNSFSSCFAGQEILG